jgi:aminotransferase
MKVYIHKRRSVKLSSIKMKNVPYSDIRKMYDAAKEIEKTGKKVVHMEMGRPDFDTPPHIVEAAVKAMREGKVHYAPNNGIPELRQAISDKYINEYNLMYSPDQNILVTNGVAEGIYLAISALLNPDEEILVPDPVWLNYNVIPAMNFVKPVTYTLQQKYSFLPNMDELEKKVTNRTRMIVLVSPSNPTGAVLSKESLVEIALFAQKHDLIILSDEIYEKIIYDSFKHHSIATIEGMKERTIILNGFSKYYSMTGWRVGYAVGPENLINPMLLMHQYMITSTTTFAQWGALEALTGDQTPSIKMVEEFSRRRDFLVDSLNNIHGFECHRPTGAFYVFPSTKEIPLPSKELAMFLLKEANIVSVAGNSFGKWGEGHIRLSYTASMEELEVAVENITKAMKKL